MKEQIYKEMYKMDSEVIDNIYVIKKLIQICGRDKREGYFVFLNLEKTYNKINRAILFRVLEHWTKKKLI